MLIVILSSVGHFRKEYRTLFEDQKPIIVQPCYEQTGFLSADSSVEYLLSFDSGSKKIAICVYDVSVEKLEDFKLMEIHENKITDQGIVNKSTPSFFPIFTVLSSWDITSTKAIVFDVTKDSLLIGSLRVTIDFEKHRMTVQKTSC